MRENLIILCYKYPFARGENFLADEINVLREYFKRIIVITIAEQPESTFQEGNVTVYSKDFTLRRNGSAIRLLLQMMHRGLCHEIHRILFNVDTKAKAEAMRSMLVYNYRCGLIVDFIQTLIRRNGLHASKTIVYSYWMLSSAYAAAAIKEKLPSLMTITRAHRGDLYEENTTTKYIPYRWYIHRNIDYIVFVSEQGRRYFGSKNRASNNSKLVVSRLGVFGGEEQNPGRLSNVVTILSCSYIKRVKKVDRIPTVLSSIEDFKIRWFHIGDGPLRRELLDVAESELTGRKNIEFSILGYLSPEEIAAFYRREHVTVFLSLSASEGIAVSVMEAMSYGVPVVATDVGGMSEIVNSTNGHLLSADPNNDEVKDAIVSVVNSNCYEALRKNAWWTWKTNFDADKNYREFAEMILGQ